jgi:hypothetical protein
MGVYSNFSINLNSFSLSNSKIYVKNVNSLDSSFTTGTVQVYLSKKPQLVSPTGDSQGVLSEKDVVNFPCEEIATRSRVRFF